LQDESSGLRGVRRGTIELVMHVSHQLGFVEAEPARQSRDRLADEAGESTGAESLL
jgi:hypothetical protein